MCSVGCEQRFVFDPRNTAAGVRLVILLRCYCDTVWIYCGSWYRTKSQYEYFGGNFRKFKGKVETNIYRLNNEGAIFLTVIGRFFQKPI